MRIKRWIQIGLVLLFGWYGKTSGAEMLIVTGDQLNVRSGPARTYDVVAVVKKEEKYKILQKQGEWYQISVEGTLGWVFEQAVNVLYDPSLQELLAQADHYFQRSQFTTPPEANAYDLYREVLQREPENAHAQKRIKQMAHTYKLWAEQAMQQGEYEKARTFYQRCLFLMPDDKDVLKLIEQTKHPAAASEGTLEIRRLRSDPMTFSNQAIAAMVQKFSFHHPADWSKHGLSPSITGNMRHDYKLMDVQGVQVILDHATGLMWQQSVSPDPMTWPAAFEYTANLNRQHYAGYTDWRVPTIEELAALMEPEKTSTKLFLTPLFGTIPLWCWSADRADSGQNAWYVSFSSGGIQQLELDKPLFVLVVRTYQ